jgi:hypothetical protein
MSLTTVALIKLPLRVFDALPRAETQPDDGSFRVKGPGGTTYDLRYLQDAALVASAHPFGTDDEALTEALWSLFGDDLADHDDDRGIFVLPSVAKPRGTTYDLVVDEVGEVGEWISLGDEDDADDAEEDPAVAGEVEDGVGPGPDFMSAIANITKALGADTLQSLQQAMLSGDMGAFNRAQERIATQMAQRPELAAQLNGLMGMMPPEVMQQAMNTSPEEMMRQVQGGLPKPPKGGR